MTAQKSIFYQLGSGGLISFSDYIFLLTVLSTSRRYGCMYVFNHLSIYLSVSLSIYLSCYFSNHLLFHPSTLLKIVGSFCKIHVLCRKSLVPHLFTLSICTVVCLSAWKRNLIYYNPYYTTEHRYLWMYSKYCYISFFFWFISNIFFTFGILFNIHI